MFILLILFIKSKIVEFKDIHCSSDVNPNTSWDTLKCFATGHCISYTSKKKAEKNEVKSDLQDKIEKVRQEISDFDMDDDSHADLGNLIEQLNSFERDLDKIINQETAGLVVRSRVKWVEHGEESSRYFCNLQKRSFDKKVIRCLDLNDGYPSNRS